MGNYIAANNAVSTLAANLGNNPSTDVVITIQASDATKFPTVNQGGTGTDYSLVSLENSVGYEEICLVTRHDAGSSSIYVTRAQESTTIRSWLIGDAVVLRMTAGVVNASFVAVGTASAAATAAASSASAASTSATAAASSASAAAASAAASVSVAGVHAATSKTTPVDADEVMLLDSASSYGLAKLTWANLKATLKAYTDTLYAAASTYFVYKNVANTFTAVQTPATGTASVSATGTFTFNPATHGQECVITCTNATTITLAIQASSLVAGTVYRLVFVAGDTSARTLAKGATVLAPGAALPYTSLTTTSGSRDHLVLFAKDTNTAEVVGGAQDVR